MIVCHCHHVNDRQIRQCVRDGCTSARTVSRICGAGSGCGGCIPLVKALVTAELTQMASEAAVEPSSPPMVAGSPLESARRYLDLVDAGALQPA